MLADDRAVERKPVESFMLKKGYGRSVPKKRPYLPNWRKFIRSGMAMNNFIASMNVFSKRFVYIHD